MNKKLLLWKRALRSILIVILLSAAGTTKSFAYDFTAVCESGQTLYYTIVDDRHHRVIVDEGDALSTISGDVVVPATVEHNGITYTVYGIGEHAFIGDTLLNSITLSDSIHYIGNGAFFSCSNLIQVVIGNNIYCIENTAFARCGKLESIELPNSLYSIGEGAFTKSGIETVTVPNSVKEMGENVFKDCSSLHAVILPDSLTRISDLMFNNCTNLRRVEMPLYIEAIGSHAFENCSSLESIEFPNALTGIGYYAFSGCSNITEIKLLLEDRARVQSSAFYNCTHLKKLTIDVPYSYGDVYFESNVFNGTNLESITIKCQKVPTITQNTFEGISRDIPIVVPCGMASQFENNEFWGVFTNIQEDLLYSYNIVTEYDGIGTVQILQEPTSCEDGILEILAIPQDGYRFLYWFISGFVAHGNPLSIEPFVDGPIKAVFDGTGINENCEMSIDVYPNPTDGLFYIDVENMERIKVYSITGQFIKEFKSDEIDITDQNAGTYLLKVFTSSRVVTKLLIKK